MLDTPCSEVVRRVLAIHSILQFPLQFPSRASPCVITFQLDSTSACTVVNDSNWYKGQRFSQVFQRWQVTTSPGTYHEAFHGVPQLRLKLCHSRLYLQPVCPTYYSPSSHCTLRGMSSGGVVGQIMYQLSRTFLVTCESEWASFHRHPINACPRQGAWKTNTHVFGTNNEFLLKL